MSSFFPNSGFLLSGTNLTEASHILWGPTRINSDRLIFEGTTGMKGIVPASAASQDKIFIITNDGEAKEILGTQPTIDLVFKKVRFLEKVIFSYTNITPMISSCLMK